MSFEKQITQGIEFRTRFDANFNLDRSAISLLKQTYRQTSDKSMEEPFFSIRQGICALAKTYAADNSVEPYTYQCLADSHVFLQACINQNITHEKYMTLTVGDVSFAGNKMFNTSRNTIKTAVANGISTQDDQQFHVWLTLADMTVIDLTITHQLIRRGLLHSPVKPENLLSVWHPERPGKFNYHPVLIDDDFLQRLRKPVH